MFFRGNKQINETAKELRAACQEQPQSLPRIEALIAKASEAVKVADRHGCLSLHAACKKKAPLKVIKELVQAWPGSVQIADKYYGWLPLHFACFYTAPLEVVQELVRAWPESVKVSGNRGLLPLHVTCLVNNAPLHVIRFLADASPDTVESADTKGESPLDIAKRNRRTQAVAVLEEIALRNSSQQENMEAAAAARLVSTVAISNDSMVGMEVSCDDMSQQTDLVSDFGVASSLAGTFKLDLGGSNAHLMYRHAVVLVVILDPSNNMVSAGSGFIADANMGLIVTASHTFFHMDAEECTSDQFGTLKGSTNAVIGIIPDGTKSARFRYMAGLIAQDIDKVDACVLRITHRFESDFFDFIGTNRPCAAIEESGVRNEKLHSLELREGESVPGESVRIVGFDQAGKNLDLKLGKHVCPAVQVVSGRVSGLVWSASCINLSHSENGSGPSFCPLGAELVVEGCTTNVGQSGGPCINSDGIVVGILSREHEERTYLVPVSEIEPLLIDSRRAFLAPEFREHRQRANSVPPLGAELMSSQELPPTLHATPKFFLLHVDDNPQNISCENRFLRNEGYKVVSTSSTSSAMTLMESGIEPDVVISDMGRHEDSSEDSYVYNDTAGLLLINEIRKTGRTMPIIIYTTFDKVKRYEDETMRVGGSAIVSDNISLFKAVEKLLPRQHSGSI